MRRALDPFLPVLGVIGLIVFWYLAVWGRIVDPVLLPSPTEMDDLERQLNRDEEMERQSRHEHHEAPHFRKESD